ncbi:hypothetical protein ILUMI_20012 [Ignelater luminosus]|uniref:Uncharacterized protein n=1 Tax=Ignelater luminosus TaxID=2038154 RepID=A0A8K0CLE2_IGNLU|nr:hypothetical protein ILUMI_20012 [Ignelater luminosus]
MESNPEEEKSEGPDSSVGRIETESRQSRGRKCINFKEIKNLVYYKYRIKSEEGNKQNSCIQKLRRRLRLRNAIKQQAQTEGQRTFA